LSALREFRGWKNRTPAANAEHGGVIYGTAEAVPFLETQFPRRGSKAQVGPSLGGFERTAGRTADPSTSVGMTRGESWPRLEWQGDERWFPDGKD
jgi:hypothetical protein